MSWKVNVLNRPVLCNTTAIPEDIPMTSPSATANIYCQAHFQCFLFLELFGCLMSVRLNRYCLYWFLPQFVSGNRRWECVNVNLSLLRWVQSNRPRARQRVPDCCAGAAQWTVLYLFTVYDALSTLWLVLRPWYILWGDGVSFQRT